MEEEEITFEQIGVPSETNKIANMKKIINLNLRIKRFPRHKANSYKPTKLKDSDEPTKNEQQQLETTPRLCNGTTCSTTNQIMSAIEELHDLIKKNCDETRQMRQDVLNLKDAMVNENSNFIPFMRGPCETLDEFNLLEYRVQEDEVAKSALKNMLDKISAKSLEKYVRSCLRSIISDKVAVKCKWHAKKESGWITVNNMTIISVVTDCTREKFPKASSPHIAGIMKVWFQTSKDRWRRSMEAEQLKSEAKQVLKHLK